MADQAAKRSEASAYDYDGDPRWADYWSNVLVPSHLAARPEVLRHFKMKFYQRYVDPELNVEALSAISSPSPRPSPSSTSGTTQRRSFTSAAGDQPNTASPSPPNRQAHEFLANAWVMVMAILAMFPLLPYSLSDKAYRLTLLGSALTNLYAIGIHHGIPRAWNAQGLQTWLQSVFTRNDFLYLIYSIVFIAVSFPLRLAMLPLCCRSLEQVVVYLRRNFANAQLYRKYLEKPCNWLAARGDFLKYMTASAEIGLGFLLLLLILTPGRSIVLAFVHWQVLRLMYRVPTTAHYHSKTWSVVGSYANPLVRRYAPFLESPIAFVEHWFNG